MSKWTSRVERIIKRDFTHPLFSTKFRRELERMSALAGPINTVIDVGASNGLWSRQVTPAWPDAHYLLVEAQECHTDALREYAAANPRVRVENAAASDQTGSLYFLENGAFGGSASHEPFPEQSTELPCVSIDDSVASHRLPGPYLIKLDTHGHEREIFAGAAKTLEQAALVIVEAYTFANFGRMTFWELCEFMADRGFRPAGMSEPMFRPSDHLLWQVDLWFLPAVHPSFADTTWDSTS